MHACTGSNDTVAVQKAKELFWELESHARRHGWSDAERAARFHGLPRHGLDADAAGTVAPFWPRIFVLTQYSAQVTPLCRRSQAPVRIKRPPAAAPSVPSPPLGRLSNPVAGVITATTLSTPAGTAAG